MKLFLLMAKYGVIPCMKAMVAMKTIPLSLTKEQAHKYVCRMVDDVSESDARAIHTFLSNCTKSMPLDFVTPCVKVEKEVMGPPLSECYSCRKQLVSYLTTEVKLYTCAGVKRRWPCSAKNAVWYTTQCSLATSIK